MLIKVLILAFMLCFETVVFAASAGRVERVQHPAWVERNGKQQPLRSGMTLEVGDRLTTGKRARALLRLAEGSDIKLGEQAALQIETMAAPSSGGVFKGVLNVLKGAFRFTTSALSKRHRRDLSIRVSAITLGIRGTDVWGKAAKSRDLVCLIEGKVSVASGKQPPLEMDQAMTFYVAPAKGPALPVSPVDKTKLKKWATQTDMVPLGGTTTRTGKWKVHLQSHRLQKDALAVQTAFRSAGYPVGIEAAVVGGVKWYRNTLTGLSTGKEARALAERLEGRMGVISPWVTR